MQATSVMLDTLPRQKRLPAELRVVCLFCVVGVIVTILLSLVGFRSEITAALSGEIPGSTSIHELH